MKKEYKEAIFVLVVCAIGTIIICFIPSFFRWYIQQFYSIRLTNNRIKKVVYKNWKREEVEHAEKVKTCIEQLQEQEKQLSQVNRNELDL